MTPVMMERNIDSLARMMIGSELPECRLTARDTAEVRLAIDRLSDIDPISARRLAANYIDDTGELRLVHDEQGAKQPQLGLPLADDQLTSMYAARWAAATELERQIMAVMGQVGTPLKNRQEFDDEFRATRSKIIALLKEDETDAALKTHNEFIDRMIGKLTEMGAQPAKESSTIVSGTIVPPAMRSRVWPSRQRTRTWVGTSSPSVCRMAWMPAPQAARTLSR